MGGRQRTTQTRQSLAEISASTTGINSRQQVFLRKWILPELAESQKCDSDAGKLCNLLKSKRRMLSVFSIMQSHQDWQ
jgi:hypothetical protein